MPYLTTTTEKSAIPGPVRFLEGSAKTRRMEYLSRANGWICHYCHAALNSPESRHNRENARTLFGHGVISFTQYRSLLDEKACHDKDMPTLDHKVPQSLGGTHDVSNLVLCCLTCNCQKAHRYTYEQFLAKKRMEVAK